MNWEKIIVMCNREQYYWYTVLVHLLSSTQLFVTPWISVHQAPLFSFIFQDLLKFMSTESVMLSNHFLFCCPFLFLPSIFPNIRVFSNELALHFRSPKDWSFTYGIHSYNEYSGLISLRIDGFDLLPAQRTLKYFLQHHTSKASILQCLAFFMVQFSHCTWILEKTQLVLHQFLLANWCLCFIMCCLNLS